MPKVLISDQMDPKAAEIFADGVEKSGVTSDARSTVRDNSEIRRWDGAPFNFLSHCLFPARF